MACCKVSLPSINSCDEPKWFGQLIYGKRDFNCRAFCQYNIGEVDMIGSETLDSVERMAFMLQNDLERIGEIIERLKKLRDGSSDSK